MSTKPQRTAANYRRFRDPLYRQYLTYIKDGDPFFPRGLSFDEWKEQFNRIKSDMSKHGSN